MPGWERLQNNFNTEHALPQQLALFPETSVTWGPITPYRRATTTAGAKPSSATTCLYLPHSFIALHCFVLPLTQICLSVGVLTPQLPRGSLQRCTGISGKQRAHISHSSLPSPLFSSPESRNPVKLLCNVLIKFLIQCLLFSALIGKPVQRNEPFLGPESCAANN